MISSKLALLILLALPGLVLLSGHGGCKRKTRQAEPEAEKEAPPVLIEVNVMDSDEDDDDSEGPQPHVVMPVIEQGNVDTSPTQYDLPKIPMPYKSNEQVWAAYPSLDNINIWRYGMVRFQESRGDLASVNVSVITRLTPSAFVHAAKPAPQPALGAPVIVKAKFSAAYGRVLKVSGETVKVACDTPNVSLPENRTKERTVPLTDIEVLLKDEFMPGAPVVYESASASHVGILVFKGKTRGCLISADGTLLELPLVELTPVDVSTIHEKDAKVLAQPASGKSIKLIPAAVAEVISGGVEYKIMPDSGESFTTSFVNVAAKP